MAQYFIELTYTVLYFPMLYFTDKYCILIPCIVYADNILLDCSVFYCSDMCLVLPCFSLYCLVLCSKIRYCVLLSYIAMYGPVLLIFYYIVQKYTVLNYHIMYYTTLYLIEVPCSEMDPSILVSQS